VPCVFHVYMRACVCACVHTCLQVCIYECVCACVSVFLEMNVNLQVSTAQLHPQVPITEEGGLHANNCIKECNYASLNCTLTPTGACH